MTMGGMGGGGGGEGGGGGGGGGVTIENKLNNQGENSLLLRKQSMFVM